MTVPFWEQERFIACHLWERGPITAYFPGEMSTKIANLLTKNIERKHPFDKQAGKKVLSSLVERGLVTTVGSRTCLVSATWTSDQDPTRMLWKPEGYRALAEPRVKADRITRLEERVAFLESLMEEFTKPGG
jgi:hypothetical protein